MRSAGKDIGEMQLQIDENGSITRGNIQIGMINGTADNPDQHHGQAFKTDGGFIGFDLTCVGSDTGFNGNWKVGDWGNTLEFTPFEADSEG